MGFRILFDEVKLKQGIYQQETIASRNTMASVGQRAPGSKNVYGKSENNKRKKLAETDFVYECALGTITIRHSNGGDSS